MPIFQIKSNQISKISAKSVPNEKFLQNLIERNLEKALEIRFLETEFPTTAGGRIDTLGIDMDGSPCIIEFKKTRNDNVINQGLSYLYWLLDHRAGFEKLVENRFGRKAKINWELPRVICIAESYSKFDFDTAAILPFKIELFRYKLYQNNLLSLSQEPIRPLKSSAFLKKTKPLSEKRKPVFREYKLEDHLKYPSKENKKLFYAIREQILGLDESIVEKPVQNYIGYKTSQNFVGLELKKSYIRVVLNCRKKITDSRKLIQKGVGFAPGGKTFNLDSEKEIPYAMSLIKQAYEATL